jgi:hypothetical protein
MFHITFYQEHGPNYHLDKAQRNMGKDTDRPTQQDEIILSQEAEAAAVRSLRQSGRVEHDLPEWAARELVRDMFQEMRPHLLPNYPFDKNGEHEYSDTA